MNANYETGRTYFCYLITFFRAYYRFYKMPTLTFRLQDILVVKIVVFTFFFLLFAFFFDFRFYLLQARDLPNDVGSEERKNGIEKVIDCFWLSVDYTSIFRRICPCKFFADVCIVGIVILFLLQSFCFSDVFERFVHSLCKPL